MGEIRVAIAGLGNCASALVQGVHYYRDAKTDEEVPGLMHVDFGGYFPKDLKFVAAFEVNKRKIGLDIADAIWIEPNCCWRFAPDVPKTGAKVLPGPIADGVAPHMRDSFFTYDPQEIEPVDVAEELKRVKADVLINYLPVGSAEGSRLYAQAALDAGVAFINAIPEFIVSDPNSPYAKEFEKRGIPCAGDDIKSQVGATIVHRVLTRLMRDRGVRIDRTYQLNFGGNMDFYNMLERDRLQSKKISKTNAVTSQLDYKLPPGDVHVGPSDYVPWLSDRKFCYIQMEGTTFGEIPLKAEVKLEVWDSPNSAGVVIDAVRCCKTAMDRGMSGAIEAPSAYFMKSPPVQHTDDQARRMVEDFIAGK